MVRNPLIFVISLACGLSVFTACMHIPSPEEQAKMLEVQAGLSAHPTFPGYLTAKRGGHEILFRPQMGNVWGRYAGRLALGELNREYQVLSDFLTTRQGYFTGSPVDRLLSAVIGQPLTFYFVLARPTNSTSVDLAIIAPRSTLGAPAGLPKQGSFGMFSGDLYGNDAALARRLLESSRVSDLLSGLQGYQILVDRELILYTYAGDELTWSNQINNAGGYPQLLVSIQDLLVEMETTLTR